MKRIFVALIAATLPVLFYTYFRAPALTGPERESLAGSFQFEHVRLDFKGTFKQGSRKLYKPMQKLESWFSSLGSSVALADLNGDGIYQEFCHVNPRTNLLTVGTVPKKGEEGSYAPFPVSFHGIHYEPEIMTPTRCIPWDVNKDGRQDLLVSFFGRGPVALIQMHEWNFEALDLMEDSGLGFMTVTMQIVDLDGDGVEEILLGDLFPRAFDLFDPHADFTYIEMPSSMGHSMNGGENRILKRIESEKGLGFHFQEIDWTSDTDQASGWTMAMIAADLSGDLLPEIYFANTFGPDQLFHNRSTQKEISFTVQQQGFGLHSTRSGRVGWDTFKAGGVDVLDYDRDGKQDIFVSNLSGWFVPEGNFLFLNRSEDFDWKTASPEFDNIARSVGLFGRGWPYDSRFADFNSDGTPELVQAYGLIGEDAQVLRAFHEQYWVVPYFTRFHQTWPHLTPKTIGKNRPNFGFYAQQDGYFHSIEEDLNLESRDCRAVAVSDMDNDLDQDFVMSCMDGSLQVFWNKSSHVRKALLLRLIRSSVNLDHISGLQSPEEGETFALGAEVAVNQEGLERQVKQTISFGGGHTGAGSPDLSFMVSDKEGANVQIRFLIDGKVQTRKLELKSGSYTIFLEEELKQ